MVDAFMDHVVPLVLRSAAAAMQVALAATANTTPAVEAANIVRALAAGANTATVREATVYISLALVAIVHTARVGEAIAGTNVVKTTAILLFLILESRLLDSL